MSFSNEPSTINSGLRPTQEDSTENSSIPATGTGMQTIVNMLSANIQSNPSSMPAASMPTASMPAASMPAASMPAASMPATSMPAASMQPSDKDKERHFIALCYKVQTKSGCEKTAMDTTDQFSQLVGDEFKTQEERVRNFYERICRAITVGSTEQWYQTIQTHVHPDNLVEFLKNVKKYLEYLIAEMQEMRNSLTSVTRPPRMISPIRTHQTRYIESGNTSRTTFSQLVSEQTSNKCFLGLPDEVIDLILRYLPPNELRRLSECSKRMCNLVVEHLKRNVRSDVYSWLKPPSIDYNQFGYFCHLLRTFELFPTPCLQKGKQHLPEYANLARDVLKRCLNIYLSIDPRNEKLILGLENLTNIFFEKNKVVIETGLTLRGRVELIISGCMKLLIEDPNQIKDPRVSLTSMVGLSIMHGAKRVAYELIKICREGKDVDPFTPEIVDKYCESVFPYGNPRIVEILMELFPLAPLMSSNPPRIAHILNNFFEKPFSPNIVEIFKLVLSHLISSDYKLSHEVLILDILKHFLPQLIDNIVAATAAPALPALPAPAAAPAPVVAAPAQVVAVVAPVVAAVAPAADRNFRLLEYIIEKYGIRIGCTWTTVYTRLLTTRHASPLIEYCCKKNPECLRIEEIYSNIRINNSSLIEQLLALFFAQDYPNKKEVLMALLVRFIKTGQESLVSSILHEMETKGLPLDINEDYDGTNLVELACHYPGIVAQLLNGREITSATCNKVLVKAKAYPNPDLCKLIITKNPGVIEDNSFDILKFVMTNSSVRRNSIKFTTLAKYIIVMMSEEQRTAFSADVSLEIKKKFTTLIPRKRKHENDTHN